MLLINFLFVISLWNFCQADEGQPGAGWSEDEIAIIKEKLEFVCKYPSKIRKWYQAMYPDRKYLKSTYINAAKVDLSVSVICFIEVNSLFFLDASFGIS